LALGSGVVVAALGKTWMIPSGAKEAYWKSQI